MVTAADISEYDIEELETQLTETRRELFNLRFQLATGRLDNFSRLSHVRKDIARMMTEIRAREIAEAEGLAAEEIPAHQAAARLRSEEEALGRTRTTAAERREEAAEAEARTDVPDTTEPQGADAETEAGGPAEVGIGDLSGADGDVPTDAEVGAISAAAGEDDEHEDEG